jgi:hypothetical protein
MYKYPTRNVARSQQGTGQLDPIHRSPLSAVATTTSVAAVHSHVSDDPLRVLPPPCSPGYVRVRPSFLSLKLGLD